jgi:hypothetical protein
MSFKRNTLAASIALALAAPLGAQAADSAELAQIRDQIRQMKESYEVRIRSLEKRLQQAEEKAVVSAEAKVPSHPSDAQDSALSTQRSALASGAFNPEMSLILSGTYGSSSADVAERQLTGFMPAPGHGHGGFNKGFSLNESELVLSANIDPWWRGYATIALSPDNEVTVEEAAVENSALGNGLSLKAGRFFSGIGYLNEQHPHAWDFADAPLAYRAFLNGNYAHDGVQAKWLAPTPLFLEFGAEAGRGARFPGAEQSKNGPGATALFAHTGGDVGDSHAWRAGLSYLRSEAKGRLGHADDLAGVEVENAFSGTSKIWVADFVWKWAPHGNATRTNFKLQGEYFRRKEGGDLTYDVNAASLGTAADAYSSSQSGGYLQGVYQFMPRWRAGLRYDRLDAGSVDYAANNAYLDRPVFKPGRSSLMFDYNPSEYSRMRLQLNRDRSMQGIDENQVLLQYVMSLGSHGAHKF